MSLLSIITGTLDRPDSLSRMIQSIIKNTQDVNWELIISDAGINQPVDLSQLPANCFVIPEKPRLGHCKGYNKIFKLARGKWVVWLNDDAVVQPNWASEAIKFMEKYSDFVGLGALYWANEGSNYKVDWYQDMPYANFGILSKEFGDEVGWFDDDILYFYGGDNSLAFKCYLAGKLVAGIPTAKVLHRPYMDTYRPVNESHQVEDARKLMNRYRPYLKTMQKVYNELKGKVPYEASYR